MRRWIQEARDQAIYETERRMREEFALAERKSEDGGQRSEEQSVNSENTDKYPPVGGVDGSRQSEVGGRKTDVGGQKAEDGGEKEKADTYGVGLPPAVEKVAGWPSLFVRNLEPSKGISIGFNSER